MRPRIEISSLPLRTWRQVSVARCSAGGMVLSKSTPAPCGAPATVSTRGSRANPQHDPANGVPRADVLHCLARTFKGELCLDWHPQLPVRSELGDRLQPRGGYRGREGGELASVTGRRGPAH